MVVEVPGRMGDFAPLLRGIIIGVSLACLPDFADFFRRQQESVPREQDVDVGRLQGLVRQLQDLALVAAAVDADEVEPHARHRGAVLVGMDLVELAGVARSLEELDDVFRVRHCVLGHLVQLLHVFEHHHGGPAPLDVGRHATPRCSRSVLPMVLDPSSILAAGIVQAAPRSARETRGEEHRVWDEDVPALLQAVGCVALQLRHVLEEVLHVLELVQEPCLFRRVPLHGEGVAELRAETPFGLHLL